MTPTTATPIPPGIEMPNEVQTRLGTLRFFDGFPDDATTQVLFDNLDFQRAVQAYLLAIPAVDAAAIVYRVKVKPGHGFAGTTSKAVSLQK